MRAITVLWDDGAAISPDATMKDIKLILAIVLAVVVVLFVLQNTEPVRVEILFWSWTASRAIVLLVVFLIGVVAGWLARAGALRRR